MIAIVSLQGLKVSTSTRPSPNPLRQHTSATADTLEYMRERRLTLGPKYVRGSWRVVDEVETLPSGRVMTVVERVSHEGRTWVGAAMGVRGSSNGRRGGWR